MYFSIHRRILFSKRGVLSHLFEYDSLAPAFDSIHFLYRQALCWVFVLCNLRYEVYVGFGEQHL